MPRVMSSRSNHAATWWIIQSRVSSTVWCSSAKGSQGRRWSRDSATASKISCASLSRYGRMITRSPRNSSNIGMRVRNFVVLILFNNLSVYQHNLSHNLTFFQDTMRFCRLLNRHFARNDGLNRFLSNKLKDATFVFRGGVPDTSAKDIDLFKSPGLCIDGGLLTAQIADQHYAPMIGAGIDTGLEGSADQFNHQVDAACTSHCLGHILLLVIYHHVRTETAQCARFLIIAS